VSARKRQIVVLCGGSGKTITANRLRQRLDEDAAEIHVVDRDDRNVYQRGLISVGEFSSEPYSGRRPGCSTSRPSGTSASSPPNREVAAAAMLAAAALVAVRVFGRRDLVGA
jgi:MYXO-CTERM domain-containing protein